MADIGSLTQEIANANARITAIQHDIAQLETEKSKITIFGTTATGMKDTINQYDITLGDKWRRTLANDAVAYKQDLVSKFLLWIQGIQKLRSSIDSAISCANSKIAEQRSIISSCQQQIAQIQAEEEMRRQQAAAAAAAAAKSVPKSRTTSRRR